MGHWKTDPHRAPHWQKTQRTGRGVPARCTIFSGCFYRTCAIRVPVVIGKWAFCDHLPLSFAFSGWPRSPDFPPKTTTEPIHCVFFPLEITYAKRPRHPPSTQAPHGPQPDATLFARPPQSPIGGDDGLICPRALALAKTPRRLTVSRRFSILFTVAQILRASALRAFASSAVTLKKAPGVREDTGG